MRPVTPPATGASTRRISVENRFAAVVGEPLGQALLRDEHELRDRRELGHEALEERAGLLPGIVAT